MYASCNHAEYHASGYHHAQSVHSVRPGAPDNVVCMTGHRICASPFTSQICRVYVSSHASEVRCQFAHYGARAIASPRIRVGYAHSCRYRHAAHGSRRRSYASDCRGFTRLICMPLCAVCARIARAHARACRYRYARAARAQCARIEPRVRRSWNTAEADMSCRTIYACVTAIPTGQMPVVDCCWYGLLCGLLDQSNS